MAGLLHGGGDDVDSLESVDSMRPLRRSKAAGFKRTREEKKRSGEDREDARRGAGNSPRERWPSSFRIRYAQMRTGRLDHWIMIG